jgi:hypothetical protein
MTEKLNRNLLVGAVLGAALVFGVTVELQLGRQYRVGQGGGFGGGGSSIQNGGGGFGMQSRCLIGGAHYGDGSSDLSTPRDINRAGFVYARVKYHMQPNYMNEVPWHHDYPDGDTMFPDNLGVLTSTTTDPNSYQIVDIDSPELFQYPFAYMSEPGYLNLLPADVKNLREYFDRGGFLLMDDFRANDQRPAQYDNMQRQMAMVFPDRTIEPVPANHPIFHAFFDLNPVDMLPPYANQDSGPVQFLSISDEKGRIQVMIDFNNDISEYWQALDVGQCSLHESGKAVQLGVNYAIYAMTH